ncbi:MAG: rod shape-determining protein MreD [bacterium]|nr:rod shape-determining protein MreD [bacterium]
MTEHTIRVGGSSNVQAKDKQPIGKVALISLGAFLLQTIVAPNITIAGVAPNFLLAAAIVGAYITSPRSGVIIGFILGLVFDLLSSGPVGSMTLIMSLIGYAFPKITSSLQVEGIGAWIAFVAISALAVNLIYAIIMAFAGAGGSFFSALLYKTLPSTVYDAVACAFGWLLVSNRSRKAKVPRTKKSKRMKM